MSKPIFYKSCPIDGRRMYRLSVDRKVFDNCRYCGYKEERKRGFFK